jgi:hypothetical protein
MIKDEVLMITTPEEANEHMRTKVYPVGDLANFVDEDGKPWVDFDALLEMVQTTVQPTTWDVVGGPGSITGTTFNGNDVLVLSQTDEVHREVAEMLQKIRGLDKQLAGDRKLPVKERPERRGGYGGLGGQSPFVTSGVPVMGGGQMGMGGMGMGMGGMGGMLGQPAPPPDLLKGLQDVNRGLQSEQVNQLQKMYQRGQGMGGMGGVGAGAAW